MLRSVAKWHKNILICFYRKIHLYRIYVEKANIKATIVRFYTSESMEICKTKLTLTLKFKIFFQGFFLLHRIPLIMRIKSHKETVVRNSTVRLGNDVEISLILHTCVYIIYVSLYIYCTYIVYKTDFTYNIYTFLSHWR